MFFTRIRWLVIVGIVMMGISMNAGAFTRAGEVSVRKVERLYKDWKFYKGNPSGTPASSTFNDASWPPVCVPHTIDTVAPTQAAEAGYYSGVAWYRKQVSIAGDADKKYFLDFEGAMQTADIYVNGMSVGRHDNSGYTGFSFDITGQVGSSTAATLAVKLDNTKSADIPPGRADDGPDYFIFNGLYRNVWLVTTGRIYIPFCGQFITTSGGTVTCKTTVKNETTAAASCKVDITVRDKSGATVGTGTLTQSVPANGSSVFAVTATVSNPALWSPETPNLYSVYTTVTTGGAVVDDYADNFGFRTFSWSNTNGFSLNGSRYQVKGACHHQHFAWVLYAVPDSRWPVVLGMIKDAGFNAVRTSHYPRAKAYYRAADSIGLLLYVEVPTWSFLAPSLTTGYWNRLTACARELVTQGYNHPSIFLWGLNNELTADFPSQITRMNDTVHSLDVSRATTLANNGWKTQSPITDVAALNYMNLTSVPDANIKVISSEYSPSWAFPCARGNTSCDIGAPSWGYWNEVANQAPRMAGGFLWVFNDYFALWNKNCPMGLVDEYHLPKNGYYLFRKNFTGKADDNPVNGTATKIVLTADLAQIQADGSDFTMITAALRNNANACIISTAPITFSVTGPATPIGPTTLAAAGGKIGLILRSTTTTGTITVNANATGLPQASTTVSSVAPFEGNVSVKKSVVPPPDRTISKPVTARGQTVVFDITGRVRSVAPMSRSSGLRTGVYIVRVEKDGVMSSGKIVRVAQ